MILLFFAVCLNEAKNASYYSNTASKGIGFEAVKPCNQFISLGFLYLAAVSYAVEIIILKFISIIFGLIIIAAPSVSAEEVVTVSGSTALLPLVAAAADAFNDQQKEYFVTVTGGGTQPGIIDIVERKVDIAMAS
jgi:ABC-type phosphate transport system substrate-binding protein